MTLVRPYVSMIAVYISELNLPVKGCGMTEWTKKDPMCVAYKKYTSSLGTQIE
jgi:hypothetical protein